MFNVFLVAHELVHVEDQFPSLLENSHSLGYLQVLRELDVLRLCERVLPYVLGRVSLLPLDQSALLGVPQLLDHFLVHNGRDLALVDHLLRHPLDLLPVLLEALLLDVQLDGLRERKRQPYLHVLVLICSVGHRAGLVVFHCVDGLLHRYAVSSDLVGHTVLLCHVVTFYYLILFRWIHPL